MPAHTSAPRSRPPLLLPGLRDDVKVQELHATPLIAAHVKVRSVCVGGREVRSAVLVPARLSLPATSPAPARLAPLLQECIGVAWARHETVGEYMTAALEWLESGGRKDAAALAKQRRVANLAQLRVKRG